MVQDKMHSRARGPRAVCDQDTFSYLSVVTNSKLPLHRSSLDNQQKEDRETVDSD